MIVFCGHDCSQEDMRWTEIEGYKRIICYNCFIAREHNIGIRESGNEVEVRSSWIYYLDDIDDFGAWM